MATIPTFDEYMEPTVLSLRALGGSANIQELYDAVTERMALSETQLSVMHGEDGTQTEAGYRMAWARTYLKKAGFLSNSGRGIWTLTQKGLTERVEPTTVLSTVRAGYVRAVAAGSIVPPPAGEPVPPTGDEEDAGDFAEAWEGQLLAAVKRMDAAAFERLCQRLLRLSGFDEVQVTGRSNDGGIDGIGIMRLQGLVSLPVIFQCKRWKENSVGPEEVRSFRGAMDGRTRHGLVFTTSRFTRAARDEANRDGVARIDLVDGEHLVRLLKDHRIGVRVETRTVESVVVDEESLRNV